MMNQVSNGILKFIPHLIIICILAVACNTAFVNYDTKENYYNALESIKKVEGRHSCDTLNKCKDISNLAIENPKYDTTTYCTDDNITKSVIHEDIIELEKLKKYLFEANTITFLVTLIVALLLGFIVSSQKDIRKETENYQKELQNSKVYIYILENFHDMYVRIESVYLESNFLKQYIYANNGELNQKIMEVVYRMYRKTRSVISLIHDKKINSTTESIKREFVATIDDTINAIEIEKIKSESKNKGKTKYLEDLNDELITLRDEILNMRIIDVK